VLVETLHRMENQKYTTKALHRKLH